MPIVPLMTADVEAACGRAAKFGERHDLPPNVRDEEVAGVSKCVEIYGMRGDGWSGGWWLDYVKRTIRGCLVR